MLVTCFSLGSSETTFTCSRLTANFMTQLLMIFPIFNSKHPPILTTVSTLFNQQSSSLKTSINIHQPANFSFNIQPTDTMSVFAQKEMTLDSVAAAPISEGTEATMSQAARENRSLSWGSSCHVLTSFKAIHSAASKVFGLPELLEMILINASDDIQIVDRFAPLGDHYTYQPPAKVLFVLQRVNSSFKASIVRSTLLQQRMFLRTYRAENETRDLRYWSPVAWMRHQLIRNNELELELFWAFDHELVFDMVCKCLGGGREAGLSKSSSPWLRPEASWRNMKICCLEGKALADVSCELQTHDLCTKAFWRVEVKDKKSETLGSLSDWLEELAECDHKVVL